MDITAVQPDEIVYPDSDGKPMADNEAQLEAIFMLAGGFRYLYAEVNDVHVASDLLWYPIEGHPEISAAPDVMIIDGCGKDLLPSYQPWRHGGHPTLVIEVRSPNNSAREMGKKLVFYDTHGVAEYLLFDPDTGHMNAWLRDGDHLAPVSTDAGWTSPFTGVSFTVTGTDLIVVDPTGRRWLLPEQELARAAVMAERAEADAHQAAAHARRAETASARADAETARADAETARADAETARADALASDLAALRARVGETD